MARIRTIKPEAFTSESLAEVTVEAERTFFGLLTQADDHGRHRDNAAIIAGLLWPLRAEHTSVHVEDDLHQLANADLICRYTGCDGRRYLHIVTWSDHQKIDKPSQSRLPSCPQHQAADRCAPCKGACSRRTEGSTTAPRGLAESSPSAPRALDLTPRTTSTPPGHAGRPPAGPGEAGNVPGSAPGRAGEKSPAHGAFPEVSANLPRSIGEDSAPGSRILDPGSLIPTGRTAPAAGVSADQLVGEYVTACAERPPSDVIGHLGRITKKLLGEGIAPEHIRAGLANFAANPKHPSVLTSMVNEAMNAPSSGSARPGTRANVPAHQAWTNPADAAAAYAEEL
ncbi:hypothetical protein KQH42_28065 [Streptomyces sp. CHA1]|uniref:hypothetical protein n=1 Tax=Streptomyces TaxID=1883 RepID=UPI001BFCD4C3|nr:MULTISPECIES: hypothetical protein [unclassified Streptomyces]MBT3161450.1 hypothetical protein [Streptomyces sp. G11C]MCO6704282.1 hypothetical protein [Streptomyces sp. CHB9.2]MCO6710551.1 hypothetical protein [Streptomyces sp. CHA3]MCO6716351.1 hypothetical protein [Streptomyces sp. CHB19.2]MCO6722482.1 hypothetical protein [Streptomyces sp. Vc714c-19]